MRTLIVLTVLLGGGLSGAAIASLLALTSWVIETSQALRAAGNTWTSEQQLGLALIAFAGILVVRAGLALSRNALSAAAEQTKAPEPEGPESR